MVVRKRVNFEMSLPVAFLREGEYFIAYTPALDLSISGKSFSEAKIRFSEAVEIFFEELVEKATLEEVLSELGWKKVKKEWRPPTLVAYEVGSFTVPLQA